MYARVLGHVHMTYSHTCTHTHTQARKYTPCRANATNWNAEDKSVRHGQAMP